MDDIISSGPDREPRWPRWRPGRRLKVVAACVTLAVAASLIWYLPGVRHPGGQARPGSLAGGLATQDDGSDAVPDPLPTKPALITGRPLPRGASLQLLAGGETPAWSLVPSGRTEPIRGLPGGGNSYQLFRVAGGWAAQQFPPAAAPGGCENCAPAPLPVYYVADGSPAARLIGTASGQPAPAAARAASGWSATRAARTWPPRRVPRGRSAAPVKRRAAGKAPAGYAIDQGTRAGLLLVQVQASSGDFGYELWDPGTRRVTRSFADVIAASPAEIASAPACTGRCRVDVLNLTGGRTREISLPGQRTAGEGAFSPDGQLLALLVNVGVTKDGYPAASQLMVATLASGRTAAVPGTTVGSGIGVNFGWQPGSRLLIAAVTAGAAGHVAADAPGQAEWQIAVWQPGDARLTTALAQTPSQSWPVMDQGPY